MSSLGRLAGMALCKCDVRVSVTASHKRDTNYVDKNRRPSVPSGQGSECQYVEVLCHFMVIAIAALTCVGAGKGKRKRGEIERQNGKQLRKREFNKASHPCEWCVCVYVYEIVER